jgi:eukaryotic-like serine/threonine-protein kinase
MTAAARRAPIPVGPFALQRRIGEGGMGLVWQALHPATGVRAAVKVLRSGKAWDLRTVNLFQTEVRAVAGMDHPAIVMILDQGTIPLAAEQASDSELVAGSPYLAMELVSGGTLYDRVGKLDWPELREVLIGVLDALAHAHARGVIHRDIKPSNIMLAGPSDLRPGPKLTDFGIAQIRLPDTDEPLDDTNFCGSPSYISPEQFQAFHYDVGPWSDLYSLGCTVWAATTGTTVYQAPNLGEMLDKHCRGDLPPYQPILDVPDKLVEWLRALLQPKLTRRVQRAADATEGLLALEGRRPFVRVAGDVPPVPQDELPTIDTAAKPRVPARIGPVPARSVEVEPSLPPWRPTVPPDWRPPTAARLTPLQLLGAGIGLFGLRRVPAIGRIAERDQLWATLQASADQGRTRAVVIRGGAGHGKSHLARWLCERAEEVGAAAASMAVHGAIPARSHGIGPMLGRMLRSVGFTRHEVLARAEKRLKQLGWRRHYLWHALTELISPSDDPEGSQTGVRFPTPDERYVVAAAYLEREARQRPLALWLDDVQWGGDAISLARHLLERNSLAPIPALVILTVRDESLPADSFEASALAGLVAHEDCEEIRLQPLDVDETTSLVGELLRLEQGLAGQVVARAEGNPLFAIQLVGDWVNRGILELRDDGLALRDDASAAIPDDIHQVWMGRFERVLAGRPASARASLEVAAALGQFVDWAEWRGACRRADTSPPASLLGDLAAQGLVRSDPQGWAFVHGMARESLERSAREQHRWPQLNSACADQLAEAGGRDVHERVGLLLVEAGRYEEALGRLLLAVQDRLGLGEFRTAAGLLKTRSRLLDRLGIQRQDPRRALGWVAQARILRQQGVFERARSESRSVVRMAEQLGWDEVRAAGLLEYGSALLALGELRDAAASLEAARQLYKRLGDTEGVAAACVTLGYALRDLGELETAVKALNRAMALREATDARSGLPECLSGLASIRVVQAQLNEASDLLLRAIAQLEQTGQLLGLARAWVTLSSVLCVQGEYHEAGVLAERARELRERMGNPSETATCCNQQGEIHRARGDLVAAEEAYETAVRLYESVGSPWVFMPRLNLALVYMDQERVGLARRGLETCWSEVKKAGRETVAQHIDTLLLPCLALEQDWHDWDERMTRVRRFERNVTLVDPDSIRCLNRAAELAEQAGQVDRASVARILAAQHRRALGSG